MDSFSGENTKSSFTTEEKKENETPALSPQKTDEARNIKDSPLESPVSNLGLFTTTEYSPNRSHFSRCQADELSSDDHREAYATDCLSSKEAPVGCDIKYDNFTDKVNLTNHANVCTPQESSNQEDISITTSDQVEMSSNPVENKSQALNHTDEEIPKGKSQESQFDAAVEVYVNVKKRTFSQSEDDDMSDISVQQQILLEQQLYERYKQEEEDRHLALKLQRELDKEQKTPDRKKGSPDEYSLRPTTSESAKKISIGQEILQSLKEIKICK